jgi:pimeloyl-ACP methyl ester carboxylesterase
MKSSLLTSSIIQWILFTCIIQLSTTLVAKAQHPGDQICEDKYLPVAISPESPKKYRVFGRLCGYRSNLKRQTVQVLVHGTTYSHNYWDWPYQPERYSYVRKMTQAGYATFAIDRIGIGKSSRPPSEEVNLKSNVYVLHQVIESLRQGKLDGAKFHRVELVGHSYGSLIIATEVTEYDDVDGVILSGVLHNGIPEIFQKLTSNFYYPAQQDPRFANQNLPDGYLTIIPNGELGKTFYNLSVADPKVIAVNEENKETVTIAELKTFPPITTNSDTGRSILNFSSEQIRVPVLIVVGQNDKLFCSNQVCDSSADVLAEEKSYFSPRAKLRTYVLLTAGHVINLHPNAVEWYEVARKWSDFFVNDLASDSFVNDLEEDD